MAEGDLSVVRLALEREIAFSTCRSKLAEVVEKTLKAELIRLGWQLEKTHDLNRLTGELMDFGSELVAVATPVCKALADAYFSDRYPGFDMDDPDWPALRTQVEQAAALLAAVKSRLSA